MITELTKDNVQDVTVADYLDYWLEHTIRDNKLKKYAHKTYVDYEYKIRLYIKPAFGHYKLVDFQYKPLEVRNWIDTLIAKGLSESFIRNVMLCLSGAMNYAVLDLQILLANPCVPVKVGAVPMSAEAMAHAAYVLSPEDYCKIIKRFPKDNCYHLGIMVPYHTGMWNSETFAIDLLKDVNFETHEISINKQASLENDIWYFKPPKYNMYRSVKIGKTLETDLKFEIVKRRENQENYGDKFIKTYVLPDNSIAQVRADIPVNHKEIMPLCAKDNGELIPANSIRYISQIIHQELGNTLFHGECLRRTHCSILAENGVDPFTLAQRIGNKTVFPVLKNYFFQNNQQLQTKDAVEIFEDYLSKYINI